MFLIAFEIQSRFHVSYEENIYFYCTLLYLEYWI